MLDCIFFLGYDKNLVNVFDNGIAFKSNFYIPPKVLQEEDNVLRLNIRFSIITDLVILIFCAVAQLNKRRRESTVPRNIFIKCYYSYYPNQNMAVLIQ